VKYVSSILYRLSVVRRKRLHGLTLVYASKGLLEESCKRIVVTISYNIPREHPHHTQVTQVQRSERKFSKNKERYDQSHSMSSVSTSRSLLQFLDKLPWE